MPCIPLRNGLKLYLKTLLLQCQHLQRPYRFGSVGKGHHGSQHSFSACLMGSCRTDRSCSCCWSPTLCPLCFISFSKIHSPSSIAQKGSISNPCPLQLEPGPLSVGKVSVAFVRVHRTQTATRQGQTAESHSRLHQSMASPAQKAAAVWIAAVCLLCQGFSVTRLLPLTWQHSGNLKLLVQSLCWNRRTGCSNRFKFNLRLVNAQITHAQKLNMHSSMIHEINLQSWHSFLVFFINLIIYLTKQLQADILNFEVGGILIHLQNLIGVYTLCAHKISLEI